MQKELEEVKAQKDALEQQLGVVNGTEEATSFWYQ